MNFPFQPQMGQHAIQQPYILDQFNRELGGQGFGQDNGFGFGGYGGYYPPRPRRCRWVRECRWVRRCRPDYSPYPYDYDNY